MKLIRRCAFVAALMIVVSSTSPVSAGWKLVPAQKAVDLTGFKVTPTSDWNQASARPGKQGRAWTHDGFGLNMVEFFAGVPSGQPIYRERNRKRNPMPKFDKSMLLPDLADLFERSFRVNNQLSDFTALQSEPASFGAHRGLRLSYRYTLPNDELVRLGEARMAVVKGRFYLANYHAPELHYFSSGLAEAQVMMDTAQF
jgi:hypothetical protein